MLTTERFAERSTQTEHSYLQSTRSGTPLYPVPSPNTFQLLKHQKLCKFHSISSPDPATAPAITPNNRSVTHHGIFKRRNLTLLFRPKRAHVRPRCRRISVVRSPVWFNRVVCRRGQRFGSRFQNLPGPPRLLPPCSRPLPPSFSSQAAEGDAAKKEEEMRQARRKAANQRRRRL